MAEGRVRITGAALGWTLVAAIAAQAACGSSGAGQPGASGSGASGSGGNRGGGGTGNGSGSGGTDCDHVVVADLELQLGTGVALAADGSAVFVLRDSFAADKRTVQALESGALRDLVTVDGEQGYYSGGANLVVNANGFFFDATAGGKHGLYRAPRAGGAAELLFEIASDGGAVEPPFVADDAYLYMVAPSPANDSLARMGQTEPASSAAAIAVSSAAFYSGGFYTMAVTGDTVYTVSGTVDLRANVKVPPPPGEIVPVPRFASYDLTLCGALGSAVGVGSTGLVLACSAGDLGMRAIYRVPFPADWPADQSTVGQGVLLASGRDITHEKILVRGTNVYYENWTDDALYRISATDGGGKTKIMATHGMKHMIATGSDVFVLSSCGLQQAPL